MKVRDRFDKNRIGDLVCDGAYKYVQNFAVEIDGKRVAEYDSLDGVFQEWEDYEEPKNDRIRVIESFIHYVEEAEDSFYCDETVQKFTKKLKAWKRLQDKGFKICGWNMAMRELDVEVPEKFFDKQGPITMEISDETRKDLDLLFGGEE